MASNRVNVKLTCPDSKRIRLFGDLVWALKHRADKRIGQFNFIFTSSKLG